MSAPRLGSAVLALALGGDAVRADPPALDGRLIRQHPCPTVAPGTCFGFQRTRWNRWEEVCPQWGPGEVVVATAPAKEAKPDPKPLPPREEAPPPRPSPSEAVPTPRPVPPLPEKVKPPTLPLLSGFEVSVPSVSIPLPPPTAAPELVPAVPEPPR